MDKQVFINQLYVSFREWPEEWNERSPQEFVHNATGITLCTGAYSATIHLPVDGAAPIEVSAHEATLLITATAAHVEAKKERLAQKKRDQKAQREARTDSFLEGFTGFGQRENYEEGDYNHGHH